MIFILYNETNELKTRNIHLYEIPTRNFETIKDIERLKYCFSFAFPILYQIEYVNLGRSKKCCFRHNIQHIENFMSIIVMCFFIFLKLIIEL